MHGLMQRIDQAALSASFDSTTVLRGRQYAAGGAVRSLDASQSSDTGLYARGRVSGSRGRIYTVDVTIEIYGADAEISSDCSCPVVEQCKHGVAVVLALRGPGEIKARAPKVAVPVWQSELAGLLAALDPSETHGTPRTRLAVQASLGASNYRSWHSAGAGPALRLRLVQEGARGNWIRTGVKWSDVPVLGLRKVFDPSAVQALVRLHSMLGQSAYHRSTADDPAVEEFGPFVAPLLAEAVEAGVEIVPGPGIASLRVLGDPVDVLADLSATTSSTSGGTASKGSATQVRIAVDHDGEQWHGDRVLPAGMPTHTVSLVRRSQHAAEILLAPLSRPLPAAVTKLLLAPEPLLVPESERAALERDWLPRLVRHVSTRSSDDSVQIPVPPRPALVLTVEWDSSSCAQLRWEWEYDDRVCLVDSPDRLGGLRDARAERAILASLPWGGPAVANEKVEGAAALDLATQVLPVLHDWPDVQVREVERPDFREAHGPIAIDFDVAGQDGDPGTSRSVDWLDLTVSIRVEGEQLPLAVALEALTLGHEAVVLPSGLYVATSRPEFTALDDLVRAAAELSERDPERVRIGTHDLGLWAQLAELGVVDAQAAEWVARAQALRDLVDLPSPAPTGVVSVMRPYQLQGFHWLALLWEHGLGGVLADDMGLGKTLQVLALISHARARGSAPFLVVAPSSVVSAWQTEAAQHTPDLRVRAITAVTGKRGATLAELTEDADVVVTTYTLLRLEQEDYLRASWGGVVLDEAHHFKNHQGKTHQAVRLLDAPFKLAVTGTPFENRLMELWALLSISVPGLYPWPTKFAEQVARPVEKYADSAALRRFRQRIRPFLLRRTKDLVAADLPPKQEQVLEVPLGTRHRRVYDTHLQKERQKILGLVDAFEQNRVAIFSALTRLRQLALAPGLVDPDQAHLGSAKLDTLVEHLREVTAEGHRALVFSQFTSYLRQVRDRLEVEGIDTCYLDGRTRDRGGVIEEFRTGSAPAFLISLKAGGVGLTLTEADYVFVLDPWWNPATEAQAVDRAHRIGQQRAVMVYRLVSTDTIEEKVMELKARKAELFAQVIDGDGLMSTSIGADDIRALFASA